jgi:hypothetical protein
MKVRMLRSLGSELIAELSLSGISGPVEGQELDVAEDAAKRLFEATLAERIEAKAEPEVPAAKGKK